MNKKILILLALLVALTLVFVACKDDPAPSDTTVAESGATNEPTTEAPTQEPPETTAEPAPETTVAPAPETTEAPAPETTEAPAPETTEAPAPETTEAPVDPADPVLMLDAEALNTLAGAAAPNVQHLGSSEVITEGAYTFVRWTTAGGDPYVAILPLGSNATLPQYMAISYRTNSTKDGQFFLGSGGGWNGQGDCFNVAWNEGDWNFQIIDLAATGVTSITDGVLTYCRLDFFTDQGNEGDYFDVEYIGFFNTVEYAEDYNFAKHPAFVEKEEAGMKGHSFDTFYVNGAMYFPEDGGASDKLDAIDNTVIFGIDEAHDSMLLRGWIGFEQAIDSFGYYIDNPYAQTFGEFKTATEDGVKAAGGEHATRFEILVPLAELERGTHTVGFVVKLADGTVARLRTEITVVIPTNYENLTVPQDQWVISGHCPQLVGKEGHANSGMVAAGGVESGALLHQGSIYLGELDLSKYSKVVVMWGCDNSDVTIGHYNNNANNRIMLLNAVMDGVMSPAEETIIAGGTYELGGWAVQAFEIDLTNVSYNGPVYVAIDALPGTFALFASVEFIGAEIADEPEHQHDYTAVVTDPTCTEKGYTTYTCACGDSYVADEVEAAGHNYVDGTCGICGAADPDYVAPEMPAEFSLSLVQGNLEGKVLYFSGAKSGNFLAMSENPADAVKVYSEKTDAGYKMYFYAGDVKTYIVIHEYQPGRNGVELITEEPTTFFKWNATANTWTVWLEGCNNFYYLGTYNTFTTISSSKIDYITGDNAANVGISQFVAIWGEMPEIPAEPETSEPETTEPEEPETEEPAGNTVDFSGFEPNDGAAKGTSYTDRTNPDGWTATGARIEVSDSDCAGILAGAPVIVLNGKTSALGTLTSPALAGGIKALSFNTAYFWSETSNIDLTITITAEDGTVVTLNVLVEAPVADTAYEYAYTLDTPITGNFTIQIVNNAPSAQDKNKDRAGIWNFTWESADAADEPEAPAGGSIDVTTTDTYGYFDAYTFTATAAGTYTFTLPAGLGLITEEAYDNWGNPVIDFYDNADGYTFSVALAAGEEYKYLIGALNKADWTITYTFTEGEVGGDEPDPEEPVVGDNVLVMGNNTIVITDADYENGGVQYTFTVEVEGTYEFQGDFFAQIYNGMGMQVGMGNAWLSAGTYTVNLGTFLLPGAGNYPLNVVLLIDEGGDDEPDEPIITGNPVIETLPFTYEITTGGQDVFDVYYDYTATEAVTLIITKPEGGLVSPTATNTWENDDNGNYILAVNAGETITLNFWTMYPATVGAFTVSIAA